MTVSSVFFPSLLQIEDDQRTNAHNVGHHFEQPWHLQMSGGRSHPQGCLPHHPLPLLGPLQLCQQKLSQRETFQLPQYSWIWFLHAALQEMKSENWKVNGRPLDLTQLVGAAKDGSGGNCSVRGTVDLTHVGTQTCRFTGRSLQDSHTNTPTRVFVPGAHKHQLLDTSFFKFNAVAVYSITQDAGNRPIQDDWLE